MPFKEWAYFPQTGEPNGNPGLKNEAEGAIFARTPKVNGTHSGILYRKYRIVSNAKSKGPGGFI